MSKLINEARSKYTTIPQNITRDKDLSLKARGMLLTLLSLPEDWNFSDRGLASILNKDKRDSVRTALKELETAGYLKRVRQRWAGGFLGNMDYIVSDTRLDSVEFIDVIVPWSGFPTVDNPTLDNPPQLNKGVKNEL